MSTLDQIETVTLTFWKNTLTMINSCDTLVGVENLKWNITASIMITAPLCTMGRTTFQLMAMILSE